MTDGIHVRYDRNQDVIVEYHGEDHQGIIVDPDVKHGTILCRIMIDPAGDYGEITPQLGIYSYVLVNEHHVRPA